MKSIIVDNISVSYVPLNKIKRNKSLFSNKPKPYQALKNVSFSIEKGEIIGIIGKNGGGKTTLLRSIANIFSPDSGSININGQTVGLLSLGAGFIPEMSGRENIYISGLLLGLTKEKISELENEIIAFSELAEFIDMPVKTYSSGMYSKLAFAITSIIQTDIILIDEILSVGDEAYKKKSYEKLQTLIHDENKTVLIVSHDLNTISTLCNRVIWLDKGEVKEIGETAQVIHDYREFVRKEVTSEQRR